MCRGECLSIRRRLSGFRSADLRHSEPILPYKLRAQRIGSRCASVSCGVKRIEQAS